MVCGLHFNKAVALKKKSNIYNTIKYQMVSPSSSICPQGTDHFAEGTTINSLVCILLGIFYACTNKHLKNTYCFDNLLFLLYKILWPFFHVST